MPVLIKQLPVIIVSQAVITKESAVTCRDVLLESFLPNSDEIPQQSIATADRDRPGAQRGWYISALAFPRYGVVPPGCSGRRSWSSLVVLFIP